MNQSIGRIGLVLDLFVFLSVFLFVAGFSNQPRTVAQEQKAVPAKKAVPEKKDDHDHEHDHDHDHDHTDSKPEGKSIEFDPLKSKGMIHEISEPLAKILKFQRKGNALQLNVPKSYSEASSAFQQIRSKARGGGGGHGSGNFWSQYVSGQTFAGRIQRSEQNFGGGMKPRPDSLCVEFLESADSNTSLEIQANDNQDFLIRVNGGMNPFYLQIVQSKNQFSVQEVNGAKAFSGSSSSFEEFCRNNPDYVQNRLLALMKYHGLSSPATRFNSVTRDHVIGLLSPANEKEIQQFKQEFIGLESAKYEDREKASSRLSKEFEKWQEVLRFAAGSDLFSLEVRSRLQKLIKEKSSPEEKEMIALVVSGDLTNDKDYLLWLLQQAKTDVQKNGIVRRLQKLTTQKFETVDQWMKYLNQQNVAVATRTKPAAAKSVIDSLLSQEGYLPQMAEATANLIQLTMTDGRLRFNQQSWSDQFGGKSIEELLGQVKNQMQKSNLPMRWLNAGGHSPNTVRHEHVLFEHIQSAIPPQLSNQHYSYGNISGYHRSNINRKVEQPHLMMQFDRETLKTKDDFRRIESAKGKPNVIRYSVRERKDSFMELTVVEHADSTLHLTVASRQANVLFHLFQASNGNIACHLLNAGSKKTVSADNFEKLYQKHTDFCLKTMYPIFSRFGIQIPKQVGGPLKIKNAPRPSKKK